MSLLREPWPGDGSDPAGFELLSAEHVRWMEGRAYSSHTVRNRTRHIKALAHFCADRGVYRPVDVTLPMLERYQRWLMTTARTPSGKPHSIRSQHYRLTDIRLFFRWLVRGHHIPANPASELELPRMPATLPRSVLSVTEAEQVLSQPDVDQDLGVRDRAILEVLYSTGMRRAELVSLKIYDVDWTRGTLMIREGKGKKDRVVPIGDRALAWLSKYLEQVRPGLVIEPDDGTIFLGLESKPLNPDYLSQVVRDYVLRAGINKEGACHLFRHTAATLMLENGADIRYIQEMLGHAKLETTQIYTRVSIKRLKEIHAATHPSARLGRSHQESSEKP